MSSTPSPKTYKANCHCGQIKYSVTLSKPLAPEGTGKILDCNCSICYKNGYLLVYPLRADVVFAPGCEEKLHSYYFGKRNKPHRFCPNCSSSVLIDFQNSDVISQRGYLAMNVRLFQDVDLEKAEYAKYDGKGELGPEYVVE